MDSLSTLTYDSERLFCMGNTPRFPDYLFLGGINKLVAVKLAKSDGGETMKVADTVIVSDLKGELRIICADSLGNLWLSTLYSGLVYMRFTGDTPSEYEFTYFDTLCGLPALDMNHAQVLDNKVVVGTRSGLYKAVYPSFGHDSLIRFEPYFSIGEQKEEEKVAFQFIKAISDSNFVYSGGNAGFLLQGKDSVVLNNNPFLRFGLVSCKAIDNNNILFGSSKELLIYNLNDKKDYNESFNTFLKKISIGDDSVIFQGTYYLDTLVDGIPFRRVLLRQPDWFTPIFDYKDNSIAFEYTSAFFEDEGKTVYSHFLEGFDSDWSKWSSETKKGYTNLSEGEYVFRVKAQNVYMVISEPVEFRFLIKTPWYRSWWAYSIYAICFILFMRIVVKLYTRKLEKDNQKLEHIVELRTREVVQQKNEIEDKNVELEQQKEEIMTQAEQLTESNTELERKNMQIVDSINYARLIQEALLPKKSQLHRNLSDSFVFFKPRNIVSGDFYWYFEKNGKIYIASSDCTGHGVPGAFMSMIGHTMLMEEAGN